MMKYHPLKCKVLSVTTCIRPLILPFDRFPYFLDGSCLDYVDSEKDLGVYINTKFNWKEHVLYLCSKANIMLGLVKRTCNFVKDTNQKRLLYLSLVSSQFNHCSVIWRPDTTTLLNKIERVQVRAIKWMLCEQDRIYTNIEYFIKCKQLDLLPLKHRMDFFALLLFHRIIHQQINIKLPSYIRIVTPSNLRTSHRDPLYFESIIKPRIIRKFEKSTTHENNKNNKCNKKIKKSYKIPKSKVIIKIGNKSHSAKKSKVHKRFFRKRKKGEKIYKNITVNEDFAENKEFSSSYFYRNEMKIGKMNIGQWCQ